MKLTLQRIKENEDATLGILFIDGEAECFTIEDQFQVEKVKAETRIPEGEYEIKLRTVGSHHTRYKNMFPNIHKGMLWLQDVPNFQYILIHIGNDDNDSEGCLLVGSTVPQPMDRLLWIGESKDAYRKMYSKIVKELENNEKVTITII